jgi:hypothetical protein
MTNRLSPAARNRLTVRGAWRRNGSRNRTAPAGFPSVHTHAIAAESKLARFTAALAHAESIASPAILPT